MRNRHAFGSFAWLVAQLAPRWRSVAFLFACTMALYAVAILVPIGFQQAIDQILSHPSEFGYLTAAVAMIAALLLFGAGATYAANRTEAELRIFLENRINRRLIHTILASDIGNRNDSGEALTIFDKSASLSHFALILLPGYVLDLGKAAACLVALSFYDWLIAVMVCTIAVSASFILSWLLNRFETLQGALLDAEMARQQTLSETLTGLASVRAQSLHAQRFRSYARLLAAYSDARRNLNAMSCRFGLGMTLTSGAISTMLLGFGGYRLMTGSITVGELFAMQLLIANIVTPILVSGDIAAKLSEIRATMAAIRQFVESRKPSGIQGRERSPDTSRIAFRDMAIAYEPGKPVLCGLTLALPPKGVVAIVGRNGSGKTTLVRALAGLIDPSEGMITYGGIASHEFRPRRITAATAIVEQDTVLFSGTVAENIARRDAGIDHDRLNRVAEAVGIAHLLERDGGRVETGGLNFSGGQRQRIAHARALYAGSRCLILDEPTAFLDAEAARAMETEILALGRDRLVLLVTHTMALAARADRILVVDDGKLVGDGTHPDLIATCAAYRILHERAEADSASEGRD